MYLMKIFTQIITLFWSHYNFKHNDKFARSRSFILSIPTVKPSKQSEVKVKKTCFATFSCILLFVSEAMGKPNTYHRRAINISFKQWFTIVTAESISCSVRWLSEIQHWVASTSHVHLLCLDTVCHCILYVKMYI